MMVINWWIVGIVAVLVAIILTFLIWKNLKDEKELEKSLNDEIKTEMHESNDEEI